MARNHLHEIVESDLFSKQLEDLGALPRIDEALRAVSWALAINPQVYAVVPGTKRLRLAKTDGFVFADGNSIPPLMIWFTIEHDHVLLRSIEINSIEEEMFDGEV
jgi:hypothetical protein